MEAKIQTYANVGTTGAKGALYAPGGTVFNRYALQVASVGGTLTAWSVTIEGSLDGAEWTVLATHSANDGSTVFAVDKPCLAVRANVGTLTLNTATGINVTIAAAQ